MRVAVTSPPATEPLDTTEVKAYLRVEHTADDALITSLVGAARAAVEARIRRRLVTQTLRVTLDAREAAPPFALPYGPVQSVTSVETWDTDTDAWVTTTASAYQLAQDRITVSAEEDAADWPDFDRPFDALRVTYVVGYGDAEDVPADLVLYLKGLVADYYEQRAPAGSMPDFTPAPLVPYLNYRA